MITLYDNSISIEQAMEYLSQIEIIKNGDVTQIDCNTEQFNTLKESLMKIFSNGTLMPAFAVSLHEDVVQAMKSDTWIKLNFNKELNTSTLPYTSLLIKAEKTYAINLIRQYDEKYEGRCIHIALEHFTDFEKLTQF